MLGTQNQNLPQHLAKVLTVRNLSWGSFLILQEYNGYIFQGVCNSSDNPGIGNNDLVEVTGSWEPVSKPLTDARLYITTKELKINSVIILNKGDNTVENLIENRANVFKVMSKFAKDFTSYFTSGVQIFTPKLIDGSSEGGSEVFKVDYFGNTRYLAQSPQLYKQIMVNSLYKPVYEISNVFRAENSRTSRHLHEFTSLDAEFPLRTLRVNEVMYHCLEVLKTMFPQISVRSTVEEMSITLKGALKLLKADTNSVDLTSQQELELYALLKKDFIFITNYPNEGRAFYTFEDQSFDVLYKGVEIISGAVRKFKYDDYIQVMKSKCIDPANFKQYLDVFKRGAIYHGGFEIGLNRVVRQHLSLTSIKDTTI